MADDNSSNERDNVKVDQPSDFDSVCVSRELSLDNLLSIEISKMLIEK